MLWYCVILCYIFPLVERALVFCNLCYSFPYIASSGGNNSTSICTCVLYSLCCIFRVVLKSLHSLQWILLLSVWNILGQILKRQFSLGLATSTDSLTFDFYVLISKLIECKQVELSAAVLAVFTNLSISVLLGWFFIFLWFSPLFIKTMLQCLNLFHNHVLFLTNFIISPFLSSIVWLNLSSSSGFYVVPFSLAVFITSSSSSLSQFISKQAEIFRVDRFRIFFCPCVLANQSLGTSPISNPVLNH